MRSLISIRNICKFNFKKTFGNTFGIKKNFSSENKSNSVSIDNDTNQSREGKEFKTFIDFLMKRERYSWDDYYIMVKESNQDQKTLWQKFTEKESNEKQETIYCNKFVSCLFPDEKFKTDFSKDDVANISKITNISENYIRYSLIKQFMFYNAVHTTIHKLRKQGKEIPSNSRDLLELPQIQEDENIKKANNMSVDQIQKMLGYSDEYVQEKERASYIEKLKARKQTWEY